MCHVNKLSYLVFLEVIQTVNLFFGILNYFKSSECFILMLKIFKNVFLNKKFYF